MSNRNNPADKWTARERMRLERERQAKKDKLRRQLVIGGSIVVTLAVAAGIGVGLSKIGGSKTTLSNAEWKDAAKEKSFAKPANTSGPQGTTLIIGGKNAKNTLEVFEDMRCPVCAAFEQSVGETVVKNMENGTYKLSFTMGTFLDDNPSLSGSGSKNALSALGAALNVSPEAFLEYKKTLYSAKVHPAETQDAFSDDATLIRAAQRVKELKGNKAFEKAVVTGVYDRWALAMSDKFNRAKGVNGTPTLKLNGQTLTAEGTASAPMTPQRFTAALDKALGSEKK